ncbi:MAG: single-stranded DNA-binding protein [Latilactobacillus sakei]
MINRVVLVGRLTRDVDLRYTQSGNAVGQFNIAVNRQFTNANGDREADFINCIIWRKSAENLSNFTHKGSQIGIDGRLQTRNYENKEGQRVYVTEVVVDNFSLLDSKASGKQSANHTQNKTQQNNQSDPFANTGQAIDISDEDLPF